MGLPIGGTGPLRPDPKHFNENADRSASKDPAVPPSVRLLLQDLKKSGLPLSVAQRAALKDLSQEGDSLLFIQDLFSLAGENVLASGRPLSHFIYSWIEFRTEKLSSQTASELVTIARKKRLALEGQGPLGWILEPMAQDFVYQTLDPSMIAGMALAFPLSRLTQFKVFQACTGLSRASFLATSQYAFGAAKVLGFGAEVSGFVLGAKTMAGLLGRHPDWSPGALWAEAEHMALLLFFLKGAGSFGGAAWKKVHGPALKPSQAYLFASHYLGAFSGHHVMGQLQGADTLTVQQNLLQSLKFLFQMEIGGSIGAALLSPLPILLPPTRPPPSYGMNWGQSWRLVGVGPKIQQSNLFMEGPSYGTARNHFRVRRLAQRLAERFQTSSQDPRVLAIAKAMDKTEFSESPQEYAVRYREMIFSTIFPDVFIQNQTPWQPLDLLQRSTEVFQHVMSQEPFRRGTGSFYDSLIQVALERTLEIQKPQIFRNLIEVVTLQRSIHALEKFMENWSFHYRYQLRESVVTLALRSPQWRKRLKNLKMPHQVHRAVAAYLATYSRGGDAAPFRNPSYNYLILRGAPGGPRQVPMEAEYALKFLEQGLDTVNRRQSYAQVLSWVVEQADLSPVPLLYFDRLFKILATGGLQEKVVEIASPDTFHWGSLYRWVSSDSLSHYPEAAAKLDGTLYTGYVKDSALAQKFARFYHSVPLLSHPDRAALHRNEFHLFAQKTLGTKSNFGADEVIELLYHRPTPLARQAREALMKQEVDFEVLSEAQMLQLVERFQPNLDDEIPEGIFLPAQRSPSGRPFIGILEIGPHLTPQQKISEALNLAAITVHEFEHYQHHQNVGPFTQSAQMRSEMRAWLEEHFYLLQQGETLEWNRSLNRSPEGFGVYLRKLIDLSYFKGPKDLVIR